jgi:GGDEF domain-containing protein
VQRAAEALRAHLREFDVVARSGDAEFLALLPDPGAAPDERVTALARAVAEEIAREATPEGAPRIGLAFGYAVYDRDGTTREALLARARVTRIQLL